jgi:hypothetical protein
MIALRRYFSAEVSGYRIMRDNFFRWRQARRLSCGSTATAHPVSIASSGLEPPAKLVIRRSGVSAVPHIIGN